MCTFISEFYFFFAIFFGGSPSMDPYQSFEQRINDTQDQGEDSIMRQPPHDRGKEDSNGDTPPKKDEMREGHSKYFGGMCHLVNSSSTGLKRERKGKEER
jgi:hypothetical protein